LQEEPSSIIIDNQKIGKSNNLKVFERKKSKEPKQDSENPPRPPMPGDNNLIINNNCII
jgi:hypothetical protein